MTSRRPYWWGTSLVSLPVRTSGPSVTAGHSTERIMNVFPLFESIYLPTRMNNKLLKSSNNSKYCININLSKQHYLKRLSTRYVLSYTILTLAYVIEQAGVQMSSFKFCHPRMTVRDERAKNVASALVDIRQNDSRIRQIVWSQYKHYTVVQLQVN